MKYQKLFEPFSIGRMRLKNRIVMGPMGTSLCDERSTPTQRFIDYYEERAKGGAGLVIVEHAYPQKLGIKSERSAGLWDWDTLPAWKATVEAIHRHGAQAAIEIGHLGRCTDYPSSIGEKAMAPSAVRCPVGASAHPRCRERGDRGVQKRLPERGAAGPHGRIRRSGTPFRKRILSGGVDLRAQQQADRPLRRYLWQSGPPCPGADGAGAGRGGTGLSAAGPVCLPGGKRRAGDRGEPGVCKAAGGGGRQLPGYQRRIPQRVRLGVSLLFPAAGLSAGGY